MNLSSTRNVQLPILILALALINLFSRRKEQLNSTFFFQTSRVNVFRIYEEKKTLKKMVFLTTESANKAEINILSARDATRPGP